MDSHSPLNTKIKLESNFFMANKFLHTFEKKLFLIKLKARNIVTDLGYHIQKEKKF